MLGGLIAPNSYFLMQTLLRCNIFCDAPNCNRALGPHLEFQPQIGRDLCCEVAHPVRQAALAHRAGKAFSDRADEPGHPVGDDEQRIGRHPR